MLANGIQKFAKRGAFQSDAGIVLSMDVHEHCTKFTQLTDRGLGVIDEHAGPAVSEHFASHVQ